MFERVVDLEDERWPGVIRPALLRLSSNLEFPPPARGVVLPSAPLLGVTGAGVAHDPDVDEVEDAHWSALDCQSAGSVLERDPAPVLAASLEDVEEAQGSGRVSHSLAGARERDPDDFSSPFLELLPPELVLAETQASAACRHSSAGFAPLFSGEDSHESFGVSFVRWCPLLLAPFL